MTAADNFRIIQEQFIDAVRNKDLETCTKLSPILATYKDAAFLEAVANECTQFLPHSIACITTHEPCHSTQCLDLRVNALARESGLGVVLKASDLSVSRRIRLNGTLIRQLRELRGLKPAAVADITGIPYSSLTNIERGGTTTSGSGRLVALANLLQYPSWWRLIDRRDLVGLVSEQAGIRDLPRSVAVLFAEAIVEEDLARLERYAQGDHLLRANRLLEEALFLDEATKIADSAGLSA